MRKPAAALLLLLFGAAANADLINTFSPPSWSYSGAAADFNFATGQYWSRGSGVSFSELFTVSRSGTAAARTASNNILSFTSNVPRITDLGLLLEEAQTNFALWSRDMTNAAWVKTTMTTAQTATGADGAASAATQLTATGANATSLQTFTLGSQAHNYSVFIKRVSGTGSVQTTIDNGGTWTACTVSNTTLYSFCTVTKTAANPVIGIRLVTNGDSVVADYSQMEINAQPTSPLATTTASVSHNADNITFQGLSPALTILQGPVGSELIQFNNLVGPTTSNASVAPRIFAAGVTTQFATTTTVQDGRSNATATLGAAATYLTTPMKIASSWETNGGNSVVGNGGTLVSSGTAINLQTGTVTVGNVSGSFNRGLNGYISRITLWPYRLPDGTLTGLTAP